MMRAISRERVRLPGLSTVIAGVLMLGLAACSGSQTVSKNGVGSGTARANLTPGTKEDFSVNVGDRIFFPTDQTSLPADAKDILRRQATWLKTYPQVRVLIQGHADERGTREYNIALSARRSANTKAYLISQGVGRSRIRTISYGKERPIAVCDDESCWSQNRRAVTVVTGAVGS